MLSHRTLQYLCTAVFMLPASACKQESSQRLIDRQQGRWEDRRPQRYVVHICDTGGHSGCERVAVDGDEVIAAQTGVRGGGVWESVGDVSDYQEPIARLFEAANEPASNCILTELMFDPKFGFVEHYFHDCKDEYNELDDQGEEVVCFAEDADSLEACDGDDVGNVIPGP